MTEVLNTSCNVCVLQVSDHGRQYDGGTKH